MPWDCPKGSFESARIYLRQGTEKEWTTMPVTDFKHAPSRLHSCRTGGGPGRKVGVSGTTARPAERAAQVKTRTRRWIISTKGGRAEGPRINSTSVVVRKFI